MRCWVWSDVRVRCISFVFFLSFCLCAQSELVDAGCGWAGCKGGVGHCEGEIFVLKLIDADDSMRLNKLSTGNT